LALWSKLRVRTHGERRHRQKCGINKK
jgi:hypothetical protein